MVKKEFMESAIEVYKIAKDEAEKITEEDIKNRPLEKNETFKNRYERHFLAILGIYHRANMGV